MYIKDHNTSAKNERNTSYSNIRRSLISTFNGKEIKWNLGHCKSSNTFELVDAVPKV